MDNRQPSPAMLVIALLWSIAALVFAARDLTAAAIVAALCSAAAIGVEFVRTMLAPPEADPALLARYLREARAGRKLAIYDRETGLFAHWYMVLRGQEECARAARYQRPLSLAIVEPRPDTTAEDFEAKARIGRWVQTELRATDIAGYLGNSRYLIIAPEADPVRIGHLLERLFEQVGAVDASSSSFPEDCEQFQQLWDCATGRLRSPQ